MARKGQRLYRCVDCGNKQYLRRYEAMRKCKPRCTSCGSTFLDPASNALGELAVGQTEHKTQLSRRSDYAQVDVDNKIDLKVHADKLRKAFGLGKGQ